tara:strand:- start:90 stop:302 length:213 start_codon:yes stop_codon:yes gene_type:complete
MSEADRLAMSRGTMTSGIDLAQVAEARKRLAEMREAMPEPTVCPPSTNWRMSTYVLAGALIGAIVWLVAG